MRKLQAFVKLTILLAGTFVIVTSNHAVFLSILLCIFGFVSFLLNRHTFGARMKLLAGISLSIIVFQILFNTGEPIMVRLSSGYLASVKIYTASLLVFVMVRLLSPSEILSLLDFLPAKIQLIVGMTFSLIPAIIEEQERISLVQKSRSRAKGSFSGFTEITAIIIPLIHRVLARAETIGITLVSRGYAW